MNAAGADDGAEADGRPFPWGEAIRFGLARLRLPVEIAADGTLGRTLEVEEPAFAYEEADQVADFGARAETVMVTVRQFGERVALGLPATATFSF